MKFPEALEALKEGKLVARKRWNGKGMFIFMRPGDELPIGMIINNVKSLPDSFKRWIADNYGDAPSDKIKFTPYICMKAADNSVVNGWLASETDIISEDWEILES